MILYKEKETDLLYEVQLFEDFVLIRPALQTEGLEKLDLIEFIKRFDEFWGNPTEILEDSSIHAEAETDTAKAH